MHCSLPESSRADENLPRQFCRQEAQELSVVPAKDFRAPIGAFASLFLAALTALAQPAVSNVTASQSAGTRSVAISYTLSHPQSLPCAVTLQASRDNGATWETVASTTGALGSGIASTPGGAVKSITWNAGSDWPALLFSQVQVQVTADDGQSSNLSVVGVMVRIPGGTFTMGDSVNEGNANERPTHSVTVGSFFLQQTEVTYAQWKDIYDWNASGSRGYDFAVGQRGSTSSGSALAESAANNLHPVTQISWWDAVKWCNAKSRKEGVLPCYYADAGFGTELKSGTLTVVYVNWLAGGSRLPTEAEWEYAARGGLPGKSYPWGDGISGSQANYDPSGDPFGGTTPVGYYNGSQIPMGIDMKNDFGLYDMAGNAIEWCWDWLGSYSTAVQTDPRGPTSGTTRVVRGGNWGLPSSSSRCAFRNSYSPGSRFSYPGFRVASYGSPLVGVAATPSAHSQVFSLELRVLTAPPTITTQPAAQSVALGGSTTLTVVATGTAPLTYQWRKGNQDIGGATNASYALGSVQTGDAGTYVVIVSNSAGTMTSTPAVLAVSPSVVSPAITTQPVGQSVTAGGNIILSVVGMGGALGYQWHKDGVPIGGATSATYALGNLQIADGGSYTVVVNNSAGTVTSYAAVVTILAPATIVRQPSDQSGLAGGSVTFILEAGGSAPLNYQWRKNGVALAGATNTALTLGNLQSGDAGGYSVLVSNGLGVTSSNTATLTITSSGTAPTITTQPSDQPVGVGGNVIMRVGVSGTAPFSFQWRKNGAAISGATSESLILPTVATSAAGSYTVVVTNAYGNSTSSVATLSVSLGPTITVPPADQSVAIGSNVVLMVTASGTAPLTYQWSKDGRAMAGMNNPILPLSRVSDADAGSYSVTVSNGAGTASSRLATLVVSPAASKIVNLSVRSGAGAGNETLIVGFVIAGQGAAKPVLVRGIGPSLAQFGVTGVLADPELTLYRESVFVQTNDDWGTSPQADQIAATTTATGAFSINRSTKDAALRVVLQTGAYTANVSSRAGTGIALVEAYDADIPALTRLVNVSARSFVDRGAGVLIVGFAIQGNTSKTVLVRGIGPALAAFGVSGTLVDPQLVLFKEGSEVVATNDDWWRGGGAQSLLPVFNAVGAFPLVSGQADAALTATLPPGSYTAQVKGAGDATGVALIEVYEVP